MGKDYCAKNHRSRLINKQNKEFPSFALNMAGVSNSAI